MTTTGMAIGKKIIRLPTKCNEPVRSHWFWCPRAKWFKSEPCPFKNRRGGGAYPERGGAV